MPDCNVDDADDTDDAADDLFPRCISV